MDISGYMIREFANKDLSNNKEEYSKYCEYARKLNSNEINLNSDPFFIDCLHQPYRSRKEYNHVDAFFLSKILTDYYQGTIIFAILKTPDKAKKDKETELNNRSISDATPIHGKFRKYNSIFLGGKGFCDGHLQFEGNVVFIKKNDPVKINKFDELLEVGYTDIATTYAHLFINKGQLARFPYGHNMIGLFIKTNYEYPAIEF